MKNSCRLWSIIFITIFSISYVYTQSNDNSSHKVSQEVYYALEIDEKVDVLIYLKDQYRFRERPSGSKEYKAQKVFTSLRNTVAQSQNELISYLSQKGIEHRSFYIVNAIKARLDSKTLDYLSRLTSIQSISLDSPVKKISNRFETKSEKQRNGQIEWGLQIIEADSVWQMGYTGQNAVIGGMDTGYDWTHPALKSKYRGYIDENTVDHNYNWHDAIHEISPLHNDSIVDPSNNPCGLDIKYPCDDGSHGTHTMGTMVGRDSNNIIGVAPNARWIGVRNMERGWGSPSTYLEGFEWFLAPTDLNGENPDPSKAPHVINNSWSCPTIEGCDSTNWHYLDMAVNALRNAGVVVVVSASNNGNACGRINSPPGMLEGTFAVAATKMVDTIDGKFIDAIAGYSSWGPVMVDGSMRLKPDISAPGSRVRSSIPGAKYGTSNGTSMAGPHVAGLVALMISANPDLAGQVEEIEDIIQLTADQKIRGDSCGDFSGNDIPNFIYGYGRINALKAVQAALQFVNTKNVKVESKKMILYPNPSNDRISIDFEGGETSYPFKISDLQGRVVQYGTQIKNGSISISSLPDGIYVLKSLVNNKVYTRKFIKQ